MNCFMDFFADFIDAVLFHVFWMPLFKNSSKSVSWIAKINFHAKFGIYSSQKFLKVIRGRKRGDITPEILGIYFLPSFFCVTTCYHSLNHVYLSRLYNIFFWKANKRQKGSSYTCIFRCVCVLPVLFPFSGQGFH